MIGLLIVGYFYVPAFNTAVNDLWNSITGLSVTSPNAGGPTYLGNINFVETQVDAITGAAVTPTAPVYRWFSSAPSGVSGGVALTVTGTTLAALPSGECWMALYGGTDFYICDDIFMAQNAAYVKAGSQFWKDLNDDNSPEFCMAINTAHIGVNGQSQTPTVNLVVPCLDFDLSITDDSPADIAGATTTEYVLPITWALSGMTVNQGTVIDRLWITVNSTIASARIIPEEIHMSGGWVGGGGQSFWSAPVKMVEGTTSYFYYITGDPTYREYQNGERYWYKTGEPSVCYLTVNFRCILGAGNNGIVTLYYETVDSAGTLTQVNDNVTIATP